ncbi:16S rRNA (guanine(966)-N(2))-methyltransferase RsmD [Pseudonocardia sp. WMMC193]|uniref:16S rRNA (guanine(966)-N(2))-methyltransferase RsmD n=1 Tax=Pseudonocardia sp. WMMC193 TaxID=2911965 RepID=UPI001F00AE42|nr:16S rRNA (guanine(966)-N(2))-methyltransferase RsmD [Pseudonocardia sp. WMMC193]MCF7550193.1 16S rRNA (guanine(966)-N(2))-methyltransferase RsmD [Pseudonocardia sp. WMMC193]
MTRIIAGQAGGRRLTVPSEGTRPTSDRVREALFSALEHDPGLSGAHVLDLCAGTGALGLEALSRGAASATFVEMDRRAVGVLRKNLAVVGLGGDVRYGPAGTVLAGDPPRPHDLVFVDPPYAEPDSAIAGWLATGLRSGWIGEGTVVVERSRSREPFPWPAGYAGVRERRYGDTVIHVGDCYGPGMAGETR